MKASAQFQLQWAPIAGHKLPVRSTTAPRAKPAAVTPASPNTPHLRVAGMQQPESHRGDPQRHGHPEDACGHREEVAPQEHLLGRSGHRQPYGRAHTLRGPATERPFRSVARPLQTSQSGHSRHRRTGDDDPPEPPRPELQAGAPIQRDAEDLHGPAVPAQQRPTREQSRGSQRRRRGHYVSGRKQDPGGRREDDRQEQESRRPRQKASQRGGLLGRTVHCDASGRALRPSRPRGRRRSRHRGTASPGRSRLPGRPSHRAG